MGKKVNYIIKQLKKGDTELFEAIYKENYHHLTDYAQHFLFSKEKAREVVQDVFMKMWEIRENLPDDLHLKSYLYIATRNHCLDLLKRQKHWTRFFTERSEQLRAQQLASWGHMDNPHEVLVTKEMEERIRQAIDSLPPRCREVFLLNRIEGLKYKEIAQKLNLSVKTVEAHIYFALRTLKDLLLKNK